jgi:DNA-binding NtrC family response regulator
MHTELSWKIENPTNGNRTANLLRDEAFDSRLSSLRDVAVELLSAVEALKTTNGDSRDKKLNLYEEVRRFESDLIRAALVRTGGNQSRAARLLGVKHTTLNAKIKRYGIDTPSPNGSAGTEEIAA